MKWKGRVLIFFSSDWFSWQRRRGIVRSSCRLGDSVGGGVERL